MWILQTEEHRISQEADQIHTKNCLLESCRVSDQTPEIRLQIPCCSCRGSGRYQAPGLSQGRPVGICQCRGAAQFSKDSASHSTLQCRAGEMKGHWKSRRQYGDGCRFWTLHLMKAPLEAFHTTLWRRHVHDPHSTAHAQRGYSTFQRSHSKAVAEADFKPNSGSTTHLLPIMPTSGASREPGKWENTCPSWAK